MEIMTNTQVKDRMLEINMLASKRASDKGFKYAIDAMTAAEMHEYTILLARQEAIQALTEDALDMFFSLTWSEPGIRGNKFIAVDDIEAYRKQFPESVMTQEQLDASRLSNAELKDIARTTKLMEVHFTVGDDRKYEDFEEVGVTLGDPEETTGEARGNAGKPFGRAGEETIFTGATDEETFGRIRTIFKFFRM